jgi:type I restriction enzyme S subunit
MNQSKMNSIPVALPPLGEQTRIVARVDELMELCDLLEASLFAEKLTRSRVREALLAEALDSTKMRRQHGHPGLARVTQHFFIGESSVVFIEAPA